MQKYIFPATCEVCGGEGMASPHGATSAWTGGFLAHSDPRVCAEVIRQREEAQKRQAAEAAQAKSCRPLWKRLWEAAWNRE